MGAFKLISFFLLSLQISMGWAVFANRCPYPDTISPGECRVGQLASKLSLSVWSKPEGSYQELLDRMFILSREANSATSSDTLDCHNLSIRSLYFENGALNLTFLDRTSFVFIDILNSTSFSSISDGPREDVDSGSGSGSQPATRIRVEYLYLKEQGQLGDEGVSDFLKYVDPSALIMLQVTGSALALFPYGQSNETLTNLQKFPKLSTLDFTGNKIKGIKTNQFQGLSSLTSVLLIANQIGVIEENGLYFEQPSTGERKKLKVRNDRLSISFEWNQLTSEGIHENHGLDSTNYRPITLTLSGNHLTSLPEGTWRKFLEAHDENLIRVSTNPLVCGGGTRWLKENRIEFESKVEGANCENDPGKNVFTSDL